MSIKIFSQKSDVETKLESLSNYITGSAGGWPDSSYAGILACYDFTIESGSDDVKVFEMNTAINSTQMSNLYGNIYDDIAQYASTQSYSDVQVYGSFQFGTYNPPTAKQPTISASFAQYNISSSFNNDNQAQYLAKRGTASNSGSFHLFVASPSNTDDTLYQISSGSFTKSSFRTILGASPIGGDSLIATFNSASIAANKGVSDYPDYVLKDNEADASFLITAGGEIGFKSYVSNAEQTTLSSGSYLNADDEVEEWSFNSQYTQSMQYFYNIDIEDGADKYVETYIISSGSDDGSRKFIGNGRSVQLLTPEKVITLGTYYNSKFSLLNTPTGVSSSLNNDWYGWTLKPYQGPSTPSGATIRMYDDSTKLVQNVEVGDVVKSYQPGGSGSLGMPDSDLNYLSWSSTDVSDSFASGSVVVDVNSQEVDLYYLINDTYKIPQLASVYLDRGGLGYYMFKKGYEVEVDDKLFNKDGNWIDVTAVEEKYLTETFYSLNVEDIDTYFSSDILVHNLPKK